MVSPCCWKRLLVYAVAALKGNFFVNINGAQGVIVLIDHQHSLGAYIICGENIPSSVPS